MIRLMPEKMQHLEYAYETLNSCILFYSVALAIYYHIKNRYVDFV